MKKNWIYAGSLGIVAAILYFSSMAGYAFPGTSAELMACWNGFDDAMKSQYPLMSFFAKMLGGGNIIAPICGTIAVITLFHLVSVGTKRVLRGDDESKTSWRIAHISAVTATLIFMLTPAVRSAATHIEPRMFDFMWAMLGFAMLIPFARAHRKEGLYGILLGLLVSFGMCDSALFILLAPFYLVSVFMLCSHNGHKPYVPMFAFVGAGIIGYFVALKMFDVAFVAGVKNLARELLTYRETSGWIFIPLFATIPFIASLFSARKAYNEQPGLVQSIYHCAMSFVVILAVATPFSPSTLMEPYGVLPVAASCFIAINAGYLLSYWWVNRRTATGIAAGGILLFVLVVSGAWNLFSFDANVGSFADKVARKIIEDMGDRRWIITNGMLDEHLMMVSNDMGKDIRIVSLARDLDEKYTDRLAEIVKRERLGGEKNDQLLLSLKLGVLPFVQDWLASDPDVGKKAVIFGTPDLWYSAGIESVPEFLFFGADESKVPDWTAWRAFDSILHAPKGWGSYHDRKITNPVDRMRLALRRHIGFVANNRGVWLQDKHRDDDAFNMYELILKEIDRDNISTMLNEVTMVGAKHPSAVAKQRELERMMKTAIDDTNRRYLLWSLSNYYGYVRNPDMFVRLGHAWARSGRPGDALAQVRRAIDFVPNDKRAILLNMMAALYANENQVAKSREIYQSVLARNDRDHDALIGMMRMELLDGNSTKAMEYLQRAAAASGNSDNAKLELAIVALMRNDLTGAKDLIKKVTDANPKNMQAWSLLAATTIQQIDSAKDAKERAKFEAELEKDILPTMEHQSRDEMDYYLLATRGFVMMQKKDVAKRKDARDAFAAASRSRPDATTAQDLVLGLDISMSDAAHAESFAKDVLRGNRNAPMANYVMGSLALERDQLKEAEAYLRKAVATAHPSPLAFNDLAEVLRRNKQYEEAERYARMATKVAPELHVAWDTLGSIQMATGKNLDEAEACIRKACELSKAKDGRETDIRMLISLIRVQIMRGDMLHAKVTIRKVAARINELSDFEKAEFEEIRKGVR